jgi:CheY-like chemotaxis protein
MGDDLTPDGSNIARTGAPPLLELPSDVDALKRAVVARDRAVAVVAHDLRNPIGIISQTGAVLLRLVNDPQALRHVQRILDVAERARNLIDDVLDIAAIEEGRFSVQRRTVDLSAIVISVIESQQALAARTAVMITMDLSPEIPLLELDERRVREVFENLIGNACKFTRSGDSIVVGASMHVGEVLIAVRDTGKGIAEDELARIFDRFWHSQKSDRRGTGLGLGICKAIVEAHGGRIWLESTPGEGTTVYFTLPAPSSPPLEAAPAAPANILIVDDRPQNLIALEAILDRPDYRFLRAESGEEALRIALREPLTLALIDVVMPGMSGLEVAAHLKAIERCKDVPILFVTAGGNDPELIQQAYEAGAADYLVKPLEPAIVRRKVAVFVNLIRRRNGEGHAAGAPTT